MNERGDTPERYFMDEAIRLALASVAEGGGPFGALIVSEGQIVGRGCNRVSRDKDPTAHAEVMAIRDACRNLGRFELSGALLYVNCEPCPMCLAACYWARLDGVVYAARAEDAQAAGFDDQHIAEQLCRPENQRSLLMRQMMREEALAAMQAWMDKPDRIDY